MSGFLPDLANWALRGGAGNVPPPPNDDDGGGDGDENNNNNNEGGEDQETGKDGGVDGNKETPAPLTPAEMRAQRLARMEEIQKRQQQQQQQGARKEPPPKAAAASASSASVASAATVAADLAQQQQASPMDIDTTTPASDHDVEDDRKPAAKTTTTTTPTPMDIDSTVTVKKANNDGDEHVDPLQQQQKKKKKSSESSPSSSSDPARKAQRKKELLLQKVLGVQLSGSSLSNTTNASSAAGGGGTRSSFLGTNASTDMESNMITLDLGGPVTDLTIQHVAEILATRLSMDPTNNNMSNKNALTLMQYLGNAYRRAAEELRTLQQSSKFQQPNQVSEFLQEIQRQIVSYAASCLMEPDLFAWAENAPIQLAHVLVKSVTDINASITFSVHGGSNNSFYYLLCEELIQQDVSGLERTVTKISNYYMQKLAKCDSVLDSNIALDGVVQTTPPGGPPPPPPTTTGSETCSATVLVSAWTALCMHKRTAQMVAGLPNFLVPAAGTPEASQIIRPVTVTPGNLFQMLAAQQTPPYLKRSGPAIEKHTCLGTVLHAGIPRNNPAFSHATILRQSVDTVERTHRQQRQILRHHQDACHAYVMAMVKAGPAARERVLTWISDALLMNRMADAIQPDPSKVSTMGMLQNMTMCLLKLCEPFVLDVKKHHLIDPGFVSSPKAHRGVFGNLGDEAVPRLGDSGAAAAAAATTPSSSNNNNETMMTDVGEQAETGAAISDDGGGKMKTTAAENGDAAYQPKNAFIPQCFFYCARSLHFSLVPGLSFHERLLRQISHLHWTITHQNPGASTAELLQSDPQFAVWVSRQRSNEVALFQEEYVQDSLSFMNLIAKVLYEQNDDTVLATLPEHFVDDICDVIMRIAKLRPELLGGGSGSHHHHQLDFKYVFKMVVKMLSEKYASMVRNYNLRGKLGDVLYEVFMPSSSSDDDRRKVPLSVATDNMAGGQTYLISDREAQETLAPSLLLLYGEVEHTGYYDKMSHRAKISTLIKYLWDSAEHRPAFRRITEKKESFIKSANGIINETNTLIATVMQKLPEIRAAQEQMKSPEWGSLSDEERKQITERLEDNEQEVRHALPLCNKTIQMFGYLNTDPDIRNLFLLEELRNRLVEMLAHVLTKLVGSKGLDLKVDNPESYQFRPKEMLRDLCAIFGLFADSESFQIQCAQSQVSPKLLESAVKTCTRLRLLKDESMTAFASLPGWVEEASRHVAKDEAFLADAPDEFLDEILSTFMKDPVLLPSGHYVDRSTITQHLLNDPIDPFNREPLSIDDLKPATELKQRMDLWLDEKRKQGNGSEGGIE